MEMENVELKHLDKCPECEGNVLISVKIKESLIRDINKDEKTGTLMFSCTGNPSHRYMQVPGEKMKRLKPVYEAVAKKTVSKTKGKKKTKPSKAGKSLSRRRK